MFEFLRSSTAALWVTALGVVFAGTQLAIMAIGMSLESVNRWPMLSVEYTRADDRFILTAQNAGTGPALVGAVEWTIDGKSYATWEEGLAALGATKEDILRWERVANRVIQPNARVRMVEIRNSEAGVKVFDAWRAYAPQRHFSICYCSAMNESWVGKMASGIAGMPVCWIADRRSLKARPAPGDACPASSFAN